MSGPEQAATVTSGQAAYEAWTARFGDAGSPAFADLDLVDAACWADVAQAAAKASKPGSERVAELVTEGNELREERDRYRSALERIADEDWILDEGLGGGNYEELHVTQNLARQVLGLEVCGCTECQVSLGLDPDDDTPAVVTAGTDHLAEQIRDLAIGDQDAP